MSFPTSGPRSSHEQEVSRRLASPVSNSCQRSYSTARTCGPATFFVRRTTRHPTRRPDPCAAEHHSGFETTSRPDRIRLDRGWSWPQIRDPRVGLSQAITPLLCLVHLPSARPGYSDSLSTVSLMVCASSRHGDGQGAAPAEQARALLSKGPPARVPKRRKTASRPLSPTRRVPPPRNFVGGGTVRRALETVERGGWDELPSPKADESTGEGTTCRPR